MFFRNSMQMVRRKDRIQIYGFWYFHSICETSVTKIKININFHTLFDERIFAAIAMHFFDADAKITVSVSWKNNSQSAEK